MSDTRIYRDAEELGDLANDPGMTTIFTPGEGWRVEGSAPVKTQLYRHFDAEDNLLYVGISLSSIKRLIAHRKGSHWFDSIAKITIETLPSRDAALQAEAKAIYREKPLHNVVGNRG